MSNQKQDHHFFATTSDHWQTADTKEEVIKLLIKRAGKEGLKLHIKHFGYMAINVYKVLAPPDAKYAVMNQRPYDVETADFEQLKVVNLKGKVEPLLHP